MSKSAHHRFFIVVSLLLVAALPAFASHSWGSYHWRMTSGQSAVTLTLGDNVSGNWDTYLRQAEADWDQSTVLNLSVGAGATKARVCKGVAGGRIEVCNAAYGFNGWLGLAQIWLSSGHIVQAVAKMNDSYFMYESEKRHVMCQEIGHGFGLGHTSEDGSSQNTCMDYYQNQSDSDMTSTSPNAHDYSLLASIYNHTHLTAGSGAGLAMMPPAMGMIDFAGREQWGEEIYRSKDGRARIFRLDFGVDHAGEHHELLTHTYERSDQNVPMNELERSPWLRD